MTLKSTIHTVTVDEAEAFAAGARTADSPTVRVSAPKCKCTEEAGFSWVVLITEKEHWGPDREQDLFLLNGNVLTADGEIYEP